MKPLPAMLKLPNGTGILTGMHVLTKFAGR